MAKTFRRAKYGNMTVQEATNCIFCGSAAKLTGEHIFSHWTHRFLPARSMRKYQVLRSDSHIDRSDRKLVKRRGDIRDWRVDCVCELPCNNGWMRQIENRARPVMMRLIDGQSFLRGETAQITPEQQKIIATWAVLKAMVAEFDQHGWVTTHHMQRKYFLRTQSPPKGWTVWIGPFLRGNWNPHWISHPFLFRSPKQEVRKGPDVAATYFNSGISTQIIGQLFIQVIRSPSHTFIEGWRFSLPDKGSFFRIWPAANYNIAWPGQFMSDRDADYVSGAAYNFIMEAITPDLRKALRL